MACILIIDDDEVVRGAAKILLEASGFDVIAVADGKSGVEAIRQREFDAVIVDLFMPGMDGLATTKEIRKFRPHVPIIAASGFMFGGACPPMPQFREMAQEAGAVLTLYKPYKPKELLETIRQAIGVAA
jgi:CheY-like chemotaxis protein